MDFFSFPTDLSGWLSFISFPLLGFFALSGLWDQQRKDRQAQAHAISEELIDKLQEKVEFLEKMIEEQSTQMSQMREEILKISTENSTYKALIQGQDLESIEFRKKAEKAMQLGEKTDQLVRENKAELMVINKNIEKLYKAIEKHLETIGEKDGN